MSVIINSLGDTKQISGLGNFGRTRNGSKQKFPVHRKKQERKRRRRKKLLSSTAFYYRFHRFSISSHKKVFFISKEGRRKLTQIFINIWLCARETITHTALHDDVEMRRKLRRIFHPQYRPEKWNICGGKQKRKMEGRISAAWTFSDESADKTLAQLFSHLQVSTCRLANVSHSHCTAAEVSPSFGWWESLTLSATKPVKTEIEVGSDNVLFNRGYDGRWMVGL